MKSLNYKKAGVDINGANLFLESIKSFSKNIGGFGAMFPLDTAKLKDPYLVSSADGVGTKLKIAFIVGKHDSVGIDLVAMNANDILCSGATPLFFLDYIATGKIDRRVLVDVVRGIADGCHQAGCVLIGGETAEMPSFYKKGEYDLAGFCVGIVEKKKIIDGSQIELGDLVIGLESNGIHSNGYSLVRSALSSNELKRMSSELLKPTRIYVNPVLSLLRDRQISSAVKGIAHITGGAFYDKIARILPKSVDVKIDKNSWVAPKIFRLIQNKGNVSEKDMYRTFNMGIGMVLIVEPDYAKTVIVKLAQSKLKSWIIGKAVKGKGQVEIA